MLRALREFAEKTDFFNALRVAGLEVQKTKPEDGQVLTVADGATKAKWEDAAAGYTDEQAQDAVGGIVGPTTGPYTLTYNDATPAITLDVDDFVGDSGSGGTKGLVPAPAAGDAAAGKVLGAGGGWVTAGGGGTFVWSPLAKPASPHAKSNYFDSSVADFTELDPASCATWSLDTGRKVLKASGTGHGTDTVSAFWKTPPSGNEWILLTHVNIIQDNNGGAAVAEAGLIIGQNLQGAPTTSDLITLSCRYRNAAIGGAGVSWSQYNSFSSYLGQAANLYHHCYLALGAKNNAGVWDYFLFISTTGRNWQRLKTGNTGWAPDSIGLFVNPTTDMIALFDFFDVQEGSGVTNLDSFSMGRLIEVG